RSSPEETDMRMLRGIAALLAILAGLALPAAPAHADAAGRGGDFVPFATPSVLLDTRNGTGGFTGARPANSTTEFQVAGRGGVPSAGARAVLLGLILVNPATAGHLDAWPSGTARPGVSMVNGEAGKVTSNAAVVALGANGKVVVGNATGSTHIVVQAEGYYTENTLSIGLGGYIPVTQTRIADTRSGLGVPAQPIDAGKTVTVKVGNGAPVPATATAAVVNLTVLTFWDGWVGAYPTGTSGTSTSLMNYRPGITASAGVVKLGTNGGVTFINKNGTAIQLVVDVEGYFTAQPTEGSGLRTLTAKRLVDTRTTGTPIASEGTIDIQVGGAAGLPTRGIGGAALNITVAGATADGYLTAWPTGGAEPASTSLNNFPAGLDRSSFAVVQPGAQGKVRIRNHSGGTVHVLVDLQGWFANPLPGVPVRPYTRSVAVQGVPAAGALIGPLEYSYVDNIGRVVHGHQPDPNNSFSVQWTVVSGNEALSGPPGIAAQPDGRLQIASQHTDSNVWSLTQLSGGATWGPLVNDGGSMAAAPVLAQRGDGSLVLLAVDADGALWDLPQAAANGAYTYWRPLSDVDLLGTPSVAAIRDGLQIFGVDTSGTVRTATLFNGGGLSGWTSLGGTGVSGSPAAVVYPGYRIRVFVRFGDGSVQTKMQDSAGQWPADWSPVGSLAVAGTPAALLSPVSGRTELVARTATGEIWSTGETAQGTGTWRGWVSVLQGGDVAATDPTVLSYSADSGQRWAFLFRTADQQSRLYTVDAGTAALSVAADGIGFTMHNLGGPPGP
ncbi:MAG TPA: hypothetical protein VFE14_05385, partial [Micromonosporaceae bacterium]|nr:hypothetical protein [Micromonosporaceae bacterium]